LDTARAARVAQALSDRDRLQYQVIGNLADAYCRILRIHTLQMAFHLSHCGELRGCSSLTWRRRRRS
jgi:hypothetical protein